VLLCDALSLLILRECGFGAEAVSGQTRGLGKRQWQVSGTSVIQSSFEEKTKIFVLQCSWVERTVVKVAPSYAHGKWACVVSWSSSVGSGRAGGKQQSGLEDKCGFYVPGGTVPLMVVGLLTLWLLMVSFV